MYMLDSAHVLHVAKTGNDGNSGKAGQYPVNLANDAKLTIGSAISAAASGDTIIIWPGDYAENVTCGSKALTIIGTNRYKSKVVPASGHAIAIGDNCVLENLSATGLGSGGYGVSAMSKTNLVVKNCELYGNYLGLYGNAAKNILIDGCHIRGEREGLHLFTARRVVVRNSIIMTEGTYGTTANCYALYGAGSGVYDNCVFRAERDDVSTKRLGAVILNSNDKVAFNNCIFITNAGSDHTGIAYAFGALIDSAVALLANCIATAVSPNASTGPYDLYHTAGKLTVLGCQYTTWSGNITIGGLRLDAATKHLINKVVQTKSDGEMTVYDNDGSSVLLTLTPSEDTTQITLTPG